MRELKVPIIVGVFLGVIILGLGARSLYYANRVVGPMETAAHEVPGVLSVELLPSGNMTDVVVTLDSAVELETVFHALNELAETTLGREFGRLIINDHRTPELSRAYHSIHFLIHEGISTGLYASMAEGIEKQLAEISGLRHRVFVDDQFVYVQLYDGDDYLYEVVPRQPMLSAYEAPTRGGRLLW